MADSNLQNDRVHAEIMEILSQIRLNEARTRKITAEVFWYPIAISSGLIGSIALIVKIFFPSAS